jgi:hypothetical protein
VTFHANLRVWALGFIRLSFGVPANCMAKGGWAYNRANRYCDGISQSLTARHFGKSPPTHHINVASWPVLR